MLTTRGDGSDEYSGFLAALKAIDYSGWIVIEAEQDPVEADPRTYAQAGLDTLKHLARDTGLI